MNKPKGFNRNKTNLQESPSPFSMESQEQGWEEQQQVYTQVKVVLNSSIQEPDYYTALINRIDDLGEGDSLILQLDNVGGNVDGCLALVDAIENTPADVTAVLSGRVYSAASIIALRCPQIQVGPYARMMIHSWSGVGGFGKYNEVVADYEFNQKFLKSFFCDTYKHFLTDQEIQQVLDGKDLYVGAEGILERLERKNKLLLAEQNSQEASEDPNNGYIVPPLEYNPEDVAFNGKEYYVVGEVFDKAGVRILSSPDSFDNSVIIYDDYNEEIEEENEAGVGTIKLFKLVEVVPDVA